MKKLRTMLTRFMLRASPTRRAKWRVAVVLVLCTAALLFGPIAPALAAAIDKVLVVVNEEAITLSEYQARHQREALEQSQSGRIAPFDGRIDSRVLNRMIDDRIQAQIAARRGLTVTAAEVERAVAGIAERNQLTPPQLFAQLQEVGISARQFQTNIREQQLIRRLVDLVVNSRVQVSEREVENFLASHEEMTASDDAFEVSHFLIDLGGKSDAQTQSDYENLEYLRQGLLAGRGTFAQFVADYADNPDKSQGGYLGWRRVDQFPDSFVAALRGTEVGGISSIIRSGSGLHLLKLHDRRQAGTIVSQQRVRHILIRPGPGQTMADALELAEQLRAQIIAGEAFEKIARVHSADQASGAEGGQLGWVNPGDFPPAFERAADALALNTVSAPVRSQAGYHLIEVLERRDSDISLELAARRARQMIFQRKAAEFYDNWYGALRDSAYIEYIAVNPG